MQPLEPKDLSHPRESAAVSLLRAWRGSCEPDLSTFVAAWPGLDAHELAELICIDLEARTERALHLSPETYLSRFPAVAADPESAVDVIYADYLARERAGERPDAAGYQARFPQFADVLADQLRLHCAIDSLDSAQTRQETSASEIDSTAPLDAANGTRPSVVSYEILEPIGSGGMGVVYKARQAALNRFVALKMLRAIDGSNSELLARFRAEAQVVASLHHPHIVQVYDSGEHDGLPYLAMELVEGGTLSERLCGAPWPPQAAAELLITLAGAVQFAHDRHVIHRDLKPANVLVVADSHPLAVKITDFGLAKLLADDASHQTKSCAFLGTPSYMAPEQAQGRVGQIAPTTDIYSLGAILFELLTGAPPFRGDSSLETLRMVLSGEPMRVSLVAPRAPRDLATICDKCLEREPRRRYQSAGELQDDLQRFLACKPIQARPTGSIERSWRWCRRNPVLATALSLVVLLLAGIAGVSWANSVRLAKELSNSQHMEQAERAANQSAQTRLWDSYLSEASSRNGSHRVGQKYAALGLIDQAAGLLDAVGRTPARELQLRNAVLASVALPDIHKLRSFSLPNAASAHCDLSEIADLLAIGSAQGTIFGYRLSDAKLLWQLDGFAHAVRPLLSRDGKQIALLDEQGATVYSLDEARPRELWRVEGVRYFCFAPGGALAAYSSPQQGMCFVATENGDLVRILGNGMAKSDFAFDPYSDRVAVCGDRGIQVIDGATGKVDFELPAGNVDTPQIAWHPAGDLLATWTDAKAITLWQIESRKKVHEFSQRGLPARLMFNTDGSLLICETMWNQRLMAWDVGTLQRVLEVPGFASHACRSTNDGRLLFATLYVDSISLSELSPGAQHELAQSLDVPLGYRGKLSISPDGRILAFSSQECLELWDASTGRRLWARNLGSCTADFDETGRLIVSCHRGLFRLTRRVEPGESAKADVASLKSRRSRTLVRFTSLEQLAGPLAPWSMSTNSNCNTAVFLTNDSAQWTIFNAGSELLRLPTAPEGDPRGSDASDDSRFVAVSGWEHGCTGVWNAQTAEKLTQLAHGPHCVPLFSPDGRFLATTPDGVTLWRTSDWKAHRRLNANGTTPTGLGIAFSPDSRVLAVGHVGGAISLVNPDSGEEWARLPENVSATGSILAFSPDQRSLITAFNDETSPAQVWDLVAMRRALSQRNLDWPTEVLHVRGDAQTLTEKIEVLIDDEGFFAP